MTSTFRQVFRNTIRFGFGDFLSRLFSVSIVILLGHLYGIAIVGVYGLAISIIQYLVPLIDFGLRHIGARLIARFPLSAAEIVARVQRRRILMASVALPFVLVYAEVAHLPFDFKVFLVLFSSIGTLYALSLDWAAWGSERMLLIGLAKAIVPGCVLVSLLFALRLDHLFAWLVIGNLVGYCLQTWVLWRWWRRHCQQIVEPEDRVAEIAESMAWRRSSVMGLAWFGNVAFNTSDMLILGVFSNPQQIGLYNASYRVINQVLVTYYLLTYVLFPQFARQNQVQRRRMFRPSVFLALTAVGAGISFAVVLVRRPLLEIIFGHPFLAAAPLLLVLVWCVPFDFLVSYFSVAYFAWGMERNVLVSALIAASVNIALNLATIPRYGAMAAAINTLVSYLIYLCCLAWSARSVMLESGAKDDGETRG